jgi:hypothetical protein
MDTPHTYVPQPDYETYLANVAEENAVRTKAKGDERRAYRCPLGRDLYETLAAQYEAKWGPTADREPAPDDELDTCDRY